MKKRNIVLVALLLSMAGFTSCSSDGQKGKNNTEQISKDQLPTNSKSFLGSVFPNASFRHTAKVNKPNYYGTEYTTSLDNNVKIDFDKTGHWTEVEMSDNSAIPVEFLKREVPAIFDYINKHYQGQSIVELDREVRKGYEVTLSSGLELIFNTKQEFVGLDLDTDKDEVLITASELPKEALTFLKEHFKEVEMVLIKKELDKHGDEYKVYLSNGIKVEFDHTGKWVEVEVKQEVKIPSILIPIKAITYIQANYTAFRINSIERELNTFKVELVNGKQEVELLFDQEGNFLRIDN